MGFQRAAALWPLGGILKGTIDGRSPYGNEFAHGKRLRIPRAVREFVDRWEREVLTPAFREVKAEERKRRKAAGAA